MKYKIDPNSYFKDKGSANTVQGERWITKYLQIFPLWIYSLDKPVTAEHNSCQFWSIIAIFFNKTWELNQYLQKKSHNSV